MDRDQGDTDNSLCSTYLPIGIDLRLMEGDDFRRTEVHKDGDLAEIKAAEWKQKLKERGWR